MWSKLKRIIRHIGKSDAVITGIIIVVGIVFMFLAVLFNKWAPEGKYEDRNSVFLANLIFGLASFGVAREMCGPSIEKYRLDSETARTKKDGIWHTFLVIISYEITFFLALVTYGSFEGKISQIKAGFLCCLACLSGFGLGYILHRPYNDFFHHLEKEREEEAQNNNIRTDKLRNELAATQANLQNLKINAIRPYAVRHNISGEKLYHIMSCPWFYTNIHVENDVVTAFFAAESTDEREKIVDELLSVISNEFLDDPRQGKSLKNQKKHTPLNREID